jgi:protein-glutamine gamma-glutamyltransferase
MIRISNKTFDPSNLKDEYKSDSIERKIIDIMSTSTTVYRYQSIEDLKFEIKLRISIISASRELNDSRFAFRVFRQSMCNTDYWIRTDEGGFLLRDDVKPSDGIKDIFINSSKYGNECATAIVIVYYKAVLNIFPVDLFNEMFPKIHLMNWHYIDDDLRIGYYKGQSDYLPGDCRYFKNPEVNPLTPQWQGENAIDLSDGTYYGHGIGIRNAEGIIEALNTRRKEGATESAYLVDSATRLDFNYLSHKYHKFIESSPMQNQL